MGLQYKLTGRFIVANEGNRAVEKSRITTVEIEQSKRAMTDEESAAWKKTVLYDRFVEPTSPDVPVWTVTILYGTKSEQLLLSTWDSEEKAQRELHNFLVAVSGL